MSPRSLWVARALTPGAALERVRIRIEAGRIAGLDPGVAPRPDDAVFEAVTAVPGFVDLQVNGGAGGAWDAEDPAYRARATRLHRAAGTTSLLATLVSAPLESLEAALERLRPDVSARGPVVGVHLEGPFLAEAKAGAHAAGVLCDPTPERVERLLTSAAGTLRLLTLAPERAGALEAIARLRAAGVVVAAGHSCATYAELRRAIEGGLSFMTHVGNASDWPSRPFDPALGYRRSEPGMVGTFLASPELSGSVILDGRHLHPALARALVELRGPERVVLVSDATAATGLPPGRTRLGAREVVLHEAGYATIGEGLAGGVLPLAAIVRTAVQEAGISLANAVRMATETPAHILGISSRKGRLSTGSDADLVLLDADLRVHAVFFAGERVAEPPPSVVASTSSSDTADRWG